MVFDTRYALLDRKKLGIDDGCTGLDCGLFLAAPTAEINALCDLQRPFDLVAAKEAVRWAEEWRMMQWVQRLNEEKGVAPSRAYLLDHWEQSSAPLPANLRPAAPGLWAFPYQSPG